MRLLEEYLEHCRAKTFSWLSWNCVHFTAGWVEYYAKSDGVLSLYATPTLSARSAAKYALSFGGLRGACTAALGSPPVSALAADIGDVVLFEKTSAGGAGTLGICNGVSAVILHPTAGFSSLPMGAASCVWKIQQSK